MLLRPAGVKYEDVAGIDKVKGDIQVAMDMLLGAPAFRAMGARPYRVRPRAKPESVFMDSLSRPFESRTLRILLINTALYRPKAHRREAGAVTSVSVDFERRGCSHPQLPWPGRWCQELNAHSRLCKSCNCS